MRSNGAVTFDSNADKKRPRNITASTNKKGRRPKRLCSKAAVLASSWHFVKTELMTNPQSTRYKESVNTLANTFFACSRFVPGTKSSNTARGGTNNAVPSNGAASLNHIETMKATRPTHRCARGLSGNDEAEPSAARTAMPAQTTARRLRKPNLAALAPCRKESALLRNSWILSGERHSSNAFLQSLALCPYGFFELLLDAKALRFK
mmetsp:Transcript_87599/g.252956  ORF Transcript_87599/g.252956 Transcript_87599/m.252956 type:complete len:207 (-) Transcript_87599:583-1203(-)